MAAENYGACLDVTLVEEGGKVDNPADPGGRTNEGVTQRTYDAFRRRKGQAKRDVYLMTSAERDEIYRSGFWAPAGCEALAAGLDLMHFDGSVNSGIGRACSWLVAARKKTAVADQVRAYADARLSFLEALRTWRTFGKGWGRRVATVEAKALKMVAQPVDLRQAAAAHATKASVAGAVSHAALVASTGAALAPALVTVSHPAAAATVGAVGVLAAAVAEFTRWTSGLRAEAHRAA